MNLLRKLILIFTTPPQGGRADHQVIVLADNRVMSVPAMQPITVSADDRAVLVLAENRTISVQPDN